MSSHLQILNRYCREWTDDSSGMHVRYIWFDWLAATIPGADVEKWVKGDPPMLPPFPWHCSHSAGTLWVSILL